MRYDDFKRKPNSSSEAGRVQLAAIIHSNIIDLNSIYDNSVENTNDNQTKTKNISKLRSFFFKTRRKTPEKSNLKQKNSNRIHSKNDEKDTSFLGLKETNQQIESQSSNQMIEFKFDQIFEKNYDSNTNNSNEIFANEKLIKTINELIDSFVSNFNDACLINLGNENLRISQDKIISKENENPFNFDDKFNYIIQLIKYSLEYTFQSIDDIEQVKTINDNYGQSIEFSASLILSIEQNNSNENELKIIDLISSSASTEETKFYNDEIKIGMEQIETNCSIDCKNFIETLNVLEKIQFNLKQFESQFKCSNTNYKHLLIIGLKLRRQIKGGLFSNRMCFIDFDSKFAELKPILESSFNGKALTYLKESKSYSKSYNINKLNQKEIQLKDELAGPIEKHHQAASLMKLTKAEWIVYKYLSSALIRTLIFVNVHKLSTFVPDSQISLDDFDIKRTFLRNKRKEIEMKILDSNLELLEFSRCIQRASLNRLKRRKRHLKTNLALSNFTLNCHSSNSTLIKDQLNFLSSPLHLRQSHLPLNKHLDVRKISIRDEEQKFNRTYYFQKNCNKKLNTWNTRSSSYLMKQSKNSFDGSSSTSSSSGKHLNQNNSFKSSKISSRFEKKSSHYYLSDSDSATSANLNSFSSTSFNRFQQTNRISSIENKQIKLKSNLLESRYSRSNSLKTSNLVGEANLNYNRHKNIIQIDCEPNESKNSYSFRQIRPDINDNLSDIYSAVAEPPKQLKLEKFLNQFNGAISPNIKLNNIQESIFKTEQNSSKVSKLNSIDILDVISANETSFIKDDEEDCKSHSSILEHLSSLAIESNSKLIDHHKNYSSFNDTNDRSNISNDAEISTINKEQNSIDNLNNQIGHLQRLLNSTTKPSNPIKDSPSKLIDSKFQNASPTISLISSNVSSCSSASLPKLVNSNDTKQKVGCVENSQNDLYASIVRT